jgi:hypothetical protein
MNVKKHIIVGVLIFLIFATPILLSIYLEKLSPSVAEQIENENISDLSLTIYYIHPSSLFFIPITSADDLIHRSSEKIVVNGSDLLEHINLFKQINQDVLIPVMKKSHDFHFRVYYMLESKKNGKIFDVLMWGDEQSMFVNKVEIKENDIFYDIIIPFLSKDDAKTMEDIKKTGNVITPFNS